MKAEYICHSGSDLLVCNAARVSFGKQKNVLDEKDIKLIRYLAREKHYLPFRHPQITLRCKAPMFVARQLGKYQTGFSWSEESRRYVKDEPEFYWPDKWRKAADNVKQGSSDKEASFMSHRIPLFEGFLMSSIGDDLKSFMSTQTMAYHFLIEQGLCAEQARMILPQNMYVNWVWTGSLLGYVNMIKERSEPNAQKETRDFAQLVAQTIQPLYPVSYGALMGVCDADELQPTE